MEQNYYRPTPGRHVGHWNVFPRDGRPPMLDVPHDQLPDEVREMIRTRQS